MTSLQRTVVAISGVMDAWIAAQRETVELLGALCGLSDRLDGLKGAMQERQRAALVWTEGLSDLLVQRHVQKFEAIVVAVHEEAAQFTGLCHAIDAQVDAAHDIFCRLRPLGADTMWKGLASETFAPGGSISPRTLRSEQPSAADYMEWMQRTQTMCWQECRFKEQLLAAITWDNLSDIVKIRRLWALQPYFVSHGPLRPSPPHWQLIWLPVGDGVNGLLARSAQK